MRTILIGVDALDPTVFEQLSAAGRLPHLTALRAAGQYRRFTVPNPPQSEVSWTSIATGLSPGGHGMFDFVHRNPATYALNLSLLPTKASFGGTAFAHPHSATTIFDQAAARGYPSTSLWWPATFPARLQAPVRTIPGLGTPDILGRLGTGFLLSADDDPLPSQAKTRHGKLQSIGRGRYRGALPGPLRRRRGQVEPVTLPVTLDALDANRATITIGKQRLSLAAGQWSPVFKLRFRAGWLFNVHAVTRAIWRPEPAPAIYFLPLQIDPEHAAWHYAAPPGFGRALWREHGPFLTLGWPQDTTGLEDGCLTPDDFLTLCDDIRRRREAIFTAEIRRFEEGLLAGVFDSLDRIQHMFRHDRPDVVDAWYEKMDATVGRLLAEIDRRPVDQWLIISDHGFTDFDYKVHLNRWLRDAGWLAGPEAGEFATVRWSETRAYAVGLNSLYLNRAGRERDGTVPPAEHASRLDALVDQLTAWRGPDGRPAVSRVYRQREAHAGKLADFGPDLIVGYNAGYRGSAATGLGRWPNTAITPNHDRWRGDHCVDAALVPGVLFARRGLTDLPQPSYRDIPALAIGGRADEDGAMAPPLAENSEDAQRLEERLKSLGYL